jgi:serine/threonine-protein kinase HipA
MENREIYVFADWLGLNEPKKIGTLFSELLRGEEIFSFEYDEGWLKNARSIFLDPDLQLFSGKQYLNNEKTNFGLFLDSSPYRWGRVLMQRREAALARKKSRKQKRLFETDYLIGVYDAHRMGGIRYKTNLDGPFLDNNHELAAPPMTSLKKLQSISLMIEDESSVDNQNYLKWLNMLIAPGTSLGGARPKASVVDDKKQLWIAKFPSKNDVFDIGAWEMVAYELAKLSGIKMSPCKLKKFTGHNHTFLTKRFDRDSNNQRIHFASAMTLLGYTDGQDFSDGISYLELVDLIITHGANVKDDLMQLWKRIVFSICVSNVDDHLRNHGFLLTSKGWVLSPAYDINPDESGNGLKLNIDETDNSLDISLALDVSDYFRIKRNEAEKIVKEIMNVVKNWKDIAIHYKISKSEQELKSRAFQFSDKT